MTVLFVVLLFSFFIAVDYFKTRPHRGTIRYSVPGYEQLGPVACDGGKKKS
jgi:hypothetical protein